MTKFTRKGVQIFFAVVLVATFVLAVPKPAEAVTFCIKSGWDYLPAGSRPAPGNLVSFTETAQYSNGVYIHYVGQYCNNVVDQVRTLQGSLTAIRNDYYYAYDGKRGYPYVSPGVIDGWWGTNTKGSLGAFQVWTGLSLDYVCGKDTWRKLENKVNIMDGSKAIPLK
ncbi:MAG: peptidoglycan-binding protein [Peptococcaceae bacterium]|nr:peptidoglycan-binding protein [Peptococcaceae bacterium]